MNALILLNGDDVTAETVLNQTKIQFDSNKNITTAQVAFVASSRGGVARYDSAHYDVDEYGLAVDDLGVITILDGRDGVTKLFEGQIFTIDMKQTDAEQAFAVLYTCTVNDYAAWLDRALAWGDPSIITFPCSDQYIIQRFVALFAPKIDATHVQAISTNITSYDWKGKTLRQVMDDMAALSAGQWRMDFNKRLYYNPVAAAPPAPFKLSTSPDNVNSFPVRVDQFKRDFSNPVNHCFARGGVDPSTGFVVQADYSDPTSIQAYGEYQVGVVSDQITNITDAVLRATTEVMTYAYPVETGQFVIWKDGLALGQLVNLHEDWLGIDGNYIVRTLEMAWTDQWTVQYTIQFGAARPSLEAFLRQLDQDQRWESMKPPVAQAAPGSVTDASIAPGGLSANVINSVNASVINGLIKANQIGGVNAGVIAGQLSASQIATVNAGSVQGQLVAGQIGSINAGVIQGVVVSSQLADGIVDTLSKYATALTPIQMVGTGTNTVWPPAAGFPNKQFPPNSYFYYADNGHFYQMDSTGTTWADQGTNPKTLTGSLQFYNVGAINANSIIGLILAAQIQSITAGQITGSIQAGQIAGVNASNIIGKIQGTQIQSIDAGLITGYIQAGQIQTVNAGSITGSIQGSQIQNIQAATITIGLIGSNQINTVNASQLIVGTATAQTVQVQDASNNVIGRIGVMTGGTYGGWFKVFGAGGNDYPSALVYTDMSGNLFVKNATFTITGGGSTIQAGPTQYFDSSYNSAALQNTDGSSLTSMVSRGLVFYVGGSKIGSLVKSPNGSYLELECTVGGGYVLINGAAGVRSDAGYKVGGTQVINSSGQWVGPAITTSLPSSGSMASLTITSALYFNSPYGINSVGQATFQFVTVASGVNVQSGGSYQMNGVQAINYLGQFVGQGVSCNAGIAGTGFNIYNGGTGKSGTFKITGTDNNVYTVTFTGGIVTNIA
jgi:hypothetical protein